jgi:hypothetical protein
LVPVSIAILLMIAAAPQATERPFSHRLHLKFLPDCKNCHPAAWTSTRPGDNLLPDPELCRKCHEEVSIKPPVVVRVVHFSHATHAKLGNIAPVIARAIDSGGYLSPPGDLRKSLDTKNQCLACHRGIDTSDKVTRAALPQMADCLVCHNRIDPPDSCIQCHGDDKDLKPASHTADFLDSHTNPAAKIEKTGCAVCHGRTFTCLGCH